MEMALENARILLLEEKMVPPHGIVNHRYLNAFAYLFHSTWSAVPSMVPSKSRMSFCDFSKLAPLKFKRMELRFYAAGRGAIKLDEESNDDRSCTIASFLRTRD